MSLLLGALACGAGSLSTGLPGLLRFFLLLFGFVSLGIGVLTAIPMPNGAYLTDGARWLRLRRGGPPAERDGALLHLYALISTGRAAAEWPPALLAQGLAISDDSIFEAAGHYFAYLYALDQSQIEVAGAHLDRALKIMERFPAPMAATYRLEAAWFAAWYRDDNATAEAWLVKAGKSSARKEPWDRLRVRAAIAIRSGRPAEGKNLLMQAFSALPAGATTRIAKRQLIGMEESLEKSVL